MPAATVWLAGVALIVKSGAAAATALKATDCITQLPVVSGLVAAQLPAADVIWCSELLPLGLLIFRRLKAGPGPVK